MAIPSRLDRYLLTLTLKPVSACLVVGLLAVLLKRLLEVVTEIANEGGQILLWRLLASMVSIYGSDLVPAAFLFGIFLVVARLGDDAEIDAMLASGVSIRRLAAPFLAIGLTLTLASLFLFGFLQPYGRYGYKAALHDAADAGWNSQIQPGVVLDAGRGFVITADKSDADSGRLKGVFIRRMASGGEQIVTARTGVLQSTANGREVQVQLQDGLQLDEAGKARLKRFQSVAQSAPIRLDPNAMRARGADPRELTLPELVDRLRDGARGQPPRVLAAELYARLAETLGVPFLPLMAIPLGMASKRGRRASGLILGGLLLMGFQHSLQFTKSMAETGRFAPGPAIAIVFSVWIGLCLWLFAASQRRPGDTPLSRFLDHAQAGLRQTRELFANERAPTPSGGVAR